MIFIVSHANYRRVNITDNLLLFLARGYVSDLKNVMSLVYWFHPVHYEKIVLALRFQAQFDYVLWEFFFPWKWLCLKIAI